MFSAASKRAPRVYGPVFVSVDVNEKGEFDGKPLAEAIEVLAKADVIGIRSAAAPEAIAEVVREIAAATPKPILVQVSVHQATAAEKRRASLGAPIPREPLCAARFHGRCGCGSARSGRSVSARVRRGDSCIHGRFGRRRFRRRQHSLIVCRAGLSGCACVKRCEHLTGGNRLKI